jgi:hypothetical protein
MDVMVQKDEAQLLGTELRHERGRTGPASSVAPTPTTAQLSPPEVAELNRRASEAFSAIAASGSATAYGDLLRGLHADGVISKVRQIFCPAQQHMLPRRHSSAMLPLSSSTLSHWPALPPLAR